VSAIDPGADHALAAALVDRVRTVCEPMGGLEIRVGKSQVAFHRPRGFAWVWRPGQYLRNPAAPAVLSIALGRQDPSPRWKEVAHPSPRHWIHHLEVHDLADFDEEVVAWLREAGERAGRTRLGPEVPVRTGR
jgi:hypothetical protein